MWPRVFINYRREDSPGSAGRLYDHLAEEIPAEHLFMDVDAIAPGVDFVNEIERAVKSCDVLLVIIGRSWLTAVDRQGKRRLDDPDDFVRLEIATALKHDVRLIPVLVDGATMPAVGDIPRDIQALVRRNAVEISHQRFATDSRHLAHALLAGEAAPKPGHERGLAPAAAARPLVVPSGGIPHAPVPMWRALAVSATVFAILSSGAIAGLWLAPEPTGYWFLQINSLAQVWVVFNVMVGPGLAAKLWLPQLSVMQFLGILGATFAALIPLYALPGGFSPIAQSHLPSDPQHGLDPILSAGFVTIPVLTGTGLVLGYFLAQALRSWFPEDGGPGFVPRMIFIWAGTGAFYGVVSFLLSSLGETAALRSSGAEAVPVVHEQMTMWADTVLFGLSWGLGFFLTLRFAGRLAAPKGR
jgi:hypothetical protein